MTLNNIVNRIKSVCLAHKQVRSFYRGLETDSTTDHSVLYPSVFLEDGGGSVTLSPGGSISLSYRLYLRDLVNVSEDSKTNEQDVQSDMLSIGLDLLAQMNAPAYNDWKVSSDNSVQLFVEETTDMCAGVIIDISITIPFAQNICAVPSDLVIDPLIVDDMKITQITYYTATAEDALGVTLSVPVIVGKKLLAAFRGPDLVRQVSNLPASDEYTWNDTTVTLGLAPNENEPFSFIYRNY